MNVQNFYPNTNKQNSKVNFILYLAFTGTGFKDDIRMAATSKWLYDSPKDSDEWGGGVNCK